MPTNHENAHRETTTVLVVFIALCAGQKSTVQNTPPKKEKRLGKYPAKVYDLYHNQIEKKPKGFGEWSSWSPWSPCSRSCGGGVTQQIRHCINRPADSRFVKKQRRRRQNWKSTNGCVGLYKRIHLCNAQDCAGDQDFRYEQCAAYNNRPFKGKLYYWEPFYRAQTECTLNCRPRGLNFYATLNKTVIDGTPCYHPVTSTGKAAHKGTRGLCIDGYCKSVNAQGVVGGSDENIQEVCHSCLRGACRGINGIYTRPDLPPGYSLVAQVPAGACGLHVQQLKHTRNLIALKVSNGSYILNGDWKFSPSKSFEVAGTRFSYISQDGTSLETVTAPGPLPFPVDIMIVTYQANPGIKYGYSVPVEGPAIAPPLLRRPSPSEQPTLDTRRLDIAPPSVAFNNQRDDPKPVTIHPGHRRTRIRRKYFHWKVTGLTPCTKSCVPKLYWTCYRTVTATHQIPVNEKRCAHLDPPALAPISCNVEPCIKASWDGFWGQCSVSCGEGVQQFIPQCKSEFNGKIIVVSEAQCPKPKPSLESRACQERECEYFKGLQDNELPQSIDNQVAKKVDWTVGPWSQCSASCGTGHRGRTVTCPSGQCHPEDRPIHAEYCNQEPCGNKRAVDVVQSQSRISTISSSSLSSQSSAVSPWLVTEWSHCSEQCGRFGRFISFN
ncbi:thrombospondin type-1 domain-containing protein 4-like [Sitophilus oryzae]|uniref:Thrombospondin type-1 domain-containing protein 4-like n=1 Tax=Sitophilus oryzae TaxID=7048 RepID=A0A6J2YJA5_SITOR|nr:thrombospondin type-1 domain-containing protein 4-like [Sitophilus oryzae]